jgi:hypothetical protein
MTISHTGTPLDDVRLVAARKTLAELPDAYLALARELEIEVPQ